MYQPAELLAIQNHCLIDELIFVDETESTNQLAKIHTDSALTDTLLFLCNHQTNGRGRGSNSWASGHGSITTSIRIHRDTLSVPIASFPLLSLATGLSICRSIQPLIATESVSVKWPNDIFIRDQKVSGILIESHPEHKEILIIGFGINVSNSLDKESEELQMKSTNLSYYLPQINSGEMLCKVLTQIQLTFPLVNTPSKLIAELRSTSYLKNKRITLDTGFETVQGHYYDIGEDGTLILDIEGIHRSFFSGHLIEII